MKRAIGLLLLIFVLFTCKIDFRNTEKPHLAFSFDDGNPNDILNYEGDKWNSLIVEQLKKYKIRSVWFVRAKELDNEKGKLLLQKWDNAGNIIANHTYNHLNYNDTLTTCVDFIREIQKCDSLINGYKNYRKIFRLPFLKGGNTIAKRDSLRAYLTQNGYKQGWVTIDASDWYVNSRLIQWLKKNPEADVRAFRDYYINHIIDRARYYNSLSVEINHRQIKHTLLLHFNLTSALFLSDLIEKFQSDGWEIDNYSEAIKDPIYSKLPNVMPAEQSLIWLLAKQNGHYENKLRYPGEDSKYEKDKMDKLGL